ncbi:hypothetical protein DFH06DRAFT_332819 [Mycena polygramma]|nr:hypothetical protein DFH06DRAFT_332819 [Mycena polygramma]
MSRSLCPSSIRHSHLLRASPVAARVTTLDSPPFRRRAVSSLLHSRHCALFEGAHAVRTLILPNRCTYDASCLRPTRSLLSSATCALVAGLLLAASRMPCSNTPRCLSVARALATTRTPLQSVSGSAYARVFGGRSQGRGAEWRESESFPSFYSCRSSVRAFPRTARHRPRRASHHLHRPRKPVRMMPRLWAREATLPPNYTPPDTSVATLAVRQDAVSQPASRTLLTDTKSSASPALSSLVRPRYRPHALLACTLPDTDTGRARPSPFAALASPSTSLAPRTTSPCPPSYTRPYKRAGLILPTAYLLHSVELIRTGTYISVVPHHLRSPAFPTNGEALCSPLCHLLRSSADVSPKTTSAHLHRSGGRYYYYPGYPRGAYDYNKLRCPASYVHAGVRDTLDVARPLSAFPACAAGWRRMRRRKDHRGIGHEG